MGHILFYKLNLEAMLMSSGLKFTISKPCGLAGDIPGQKGGPELLVGHDDVRDPNASVVSRDDVARVMVAAMSSPELGDGLRFDLCAKDGTKTTDLDALLKAARYKWQSKESREGQVMV